MFRSESDLYPSLKAFLEARGFAVKGEVRGCDLVATKDGEASLIVEMKLRFTLPLVLQGVERLALSDRVYLAVPGPARATRGISAEHRTVKKLCRRLGLGLIAVYARPRAPPRVEVLAEPVPYAPRKNKRKAALLLAEHARRQGDPNRGGTTKVRLVTAYRQEALRCAALLKERGPTRVRDVRAGAEAPSAGRILYDNVYGWFAPAGRGVYALAPEGERGLAEFADRA
jgi:hypothetical protein